MPIDSSSRSLIKPDITTNPIEAGRSRALPVLSVFQPTRYLRPFALVLGRIGSFRRRETEKSLSQIRGQLLVNLTRALAGVAAAQSEEEVAEIVQNAACLLVGCDGVSFVSGDGDPAHCFDNGASEPSRRDQLLALTSIATGWTKADRRTAYFSAKPPVERAHPGVLIATFPKTLTMTLVGTETPIRAIAAYWSKPHIASRAEIAILSALADVAAIAIERSRQSASIFAALENAELARDELRHRVKNAYMGAAALARLSLSPEFADPLTARIQSLARAQDLLDGSVDKLSRFDLATLINSELQPYATDAAERFALGGPSVDLPSSLAVPIGLVINELATNALKHGALSLKHGTVNINWRHGLNELIFTWCETGGPKVETSAIPSQGSSLLRRIVERQLRGSLVHRLEASGVRCAFSIPLSRP